MSYEINIDALVYNKRRSNTPHKVPEKGVFFIGPLHTLPGQVLSSVHMGNFSPVEWHKIRETKTNWCISVLSFVTVAALSTPVINFTNKDNLHTCEVDMPFWPLFCESEAILSKKFRPGYRDCENIFSPIRPISRDLGNQASPPSHMNTPKCLQRIKRCAEISQTGLARSTGLI